MKLSKPMSDLLKEILLQESYKKALPILRRADKQLKISLKTMPWHKAHDEMAYVINQGHEIWREKICKGVNHDKQ